MSKIRLEFYPPEFLAYCQRIGPDTKASIEIDMGSKSKAESLRSKFYSWRRLATATYGEDFALQHYLSLVFVQIEDSVIKFSNRANSKDHALLREALNKLGPMSNEAI